MNKDPVVTDVSLTISRITDLSSVTSHMRINIVDAASRDRIVEVTLSLEDMMRALTSVANVKAEASVWPCQNVGKTRETEIVEVEDITGASKSVRDRHVHEVFNKTYAGAWEGYTYTRTNRGTIKLSLYRYV